MYAASATNDSVEDPVARATAALKRVATLLVGINPLLDAQDRFRRAMLVEALRCAQGNLTRAAELLGVRRQAVQHMVERYELRRWSNTLRLASSTTQVKPVQRAGSEESRSWVRSEAESAGRTAERELPSSRPPCRLTKV
jgi:hypothetical protein